MSLIEQADVMDHTRVFEYRDVEEAVLEFEQFLNDFGVIDKRRFKDCGLFERYKKIFGDFEK